MAITTQASAQYTLALGVTGSKNEENDYGAAVRVFPFEFVQGAVAGDANSLANLILIPGGRWRLLAAASFLQWSAFGAARLLDIGYLAYTGLDGATVAASADGIDIDINVAAAGQQLGLGANITAGQGRFLEFNSLSGVTIQAVCEVDTLPAAAKLSGFFLLARS